MRLTIMLLVGFAPLGAVSQTVAPVPSNYPVLSHIDSTAQLAELMHATEGPIHLEKYDFLKVSVYGADALSERVLIAPDGTIPVPLAGSIPVAGLTLAEAQEAIADLIRAKQLVVTPDVMIDILKAPSRVITIDGQVKTPGVYPAVGTSEDNKIGNDGIRTLGQLLGVAGGLSDTASGVVTLIRPSLPDPVSIPLGPDPNKNIYLRLPLFAGDEIQVSHCGQSYVIGAVKKQGTILLKSYSPTTVSQAIAISDGIGYEASADDARLVRTQDGQRVMLKVQVRKILEGKAPDIALQNDDILYVPTNAAKAALKGGGAGFVVSLLSTYLYTH